MNKLIVFSRVITLILIALLFTSCQASEKNKWTPPKFVKEWEIKEIKPGLPHHIISMTANKNGVFVLVRAEERKYTPPMKWDELTAEEKKKETEMMKAMFGRILSEKERLSDKGSLFSRKEEINHYRVQHYNFDGTFTAQWPEDNKLSLHDDLKKNTKNIVVRLYDQVKKNFYDIDSRDYLIKPLRIISDDLAMIYLADYEGNKIVKFNSEGSRLNVWEITKKEDETGKYDYLEGHKGMSIVHDHVYITSDAHFLRGPVISFFDLKGSLIKEKALSIPKVPSINPYEYPAQKHPFVKDEGNVNDMAVDKEGNIYLLAGMIKIFKYNKDFKEVKSFEPILKEGFNTDIKIYDSKTNKYIPYSNPNLKQFKTYNTQKGAGFGLEVRDYDLDKLYFSPKDELFVTFKGAKPFGEILAGIYNKDGRMIGYWKVDKKSNSEWFEGLPDIDKINAREMGLNLAFHENSIFVAKTIEIQPWEWENDKSLWSKTGTISFRSVIQRFDR